MDRDSLVRVNFAGGKVQRQAVAGDVGGWVHQLDRCFSAQLVHRSRDQRTTRLTICLEGSHSNASGMGSGAGGMDWAKRALKFHGASRHRVALSVAHSCSDLRCTSGHGQDQCIRLEQEQRGRLCFGG